MLGLTLFFFELSYAIRFLWDKCAYEVIVEKNNNLFAYYLMYDIVTFFDGMSFFALLYCHFKNFREDQKQIEESDQSG